MSEVGSGRSDKDFLSDTSGMSRTILQQAFEVQLQTISDLSKEIDQSNQNNLEKEGLKNDSTGNSFKSCR